MRPARTNSHPADAPAGFSPLTASVHIPATGAGKGFRGAAAVNSGVGAGDTWVNDQQARKATVAGSTAATTAAAAAAAAAAAVGSSQAAVTRQFANADLSSPVKAAAQQQQSQQQHDQPQQAPLVQVVDPPVVAEESSLSPAAVAAAHDLDDAYDPEDLDDDWKVGIDGLVCVGRCLTLVTTDSGLL